MCITQFASIYDCHLKTTRISKRYEYQFCIFCDISRRKQVNDANSGPKLVTVPGRSSIVSAESWQESFSQTYISGVTCDRNNVTRSSAFSLSANHLAGYRFFFLFFFANFLPGSCPSTTSFFSQFRCRSVTASTSFTTRIVHFGWKKKRWSLADFLQKEIRKKLVHVCNGIVVNGYLMNLLSSETISNTGVVGKLSGLKAHRARLRKRYKEPLAVCGSCSFRDRPYAIARRHRSR